MKKLFFLHIYLFIGLSIYSQQSDITISGNFIQTPFINFIDEIEKTTDIKCYYDENLLKNVNVTCFGTDLKLDSLLHNFFYNTDLKFYFDNNQLFIYTGKKIKTRIPDFINISQNDLNSVGIKDSITQSEKKYLESKKIASTEVLLVGKKQNMVEGSKCIVNGKIIDETTGEFLIGATIYIEKLKLGAVSDIDGNFRLILSTGKYKVLFNYLSMKPKEYYLQVYTSGDVTIKMKKELIEIDEVKVTANYNDNVKGMQMGYKKISAKTMKEIPLVMGEKDILKVAQMLPGVQNTGEGSSGFNIRGSSNDQNMFYINNIPVYNTSHLFGFFSAFSPDIINDFTLYKSNIPAKFGGRVASVFDITTRQGSKKKFFGKGGISPITAHASLEVPAVTDKVSVVVSWRGSYSDWILSQIRDEDIHKSHASFYDASFSVNTEINNKNLVKIFGYQSSDEFSLSSINDYNYSNTGTSIIWKHIFSSTLTSDLSLVYSSYKFKNIDKNNISESYSHNYNIDHYEAKIDFSLQNKYNHKIDFGGSEIFYDLNRGEILPYGDESLRIPIYLGAEKGMEGAVYISDEFTLLRNLNVLGGLRYSVYTQLGPAEVNEYDPENIKITDNIVDTKIYDKGEIVKLYSGPEYRVAFNYILGLNSSVKASYNRLYQYIFMLSNTIAISPDDQWKLCDYHIDPPVCDQVSIGYYRNIKNIGVNVSLELYHKWIKNKVEYKDGAEFISPEPIEAQTLQGEQTVDGMEIMINKEFGKLSGWLSYSYSRSFVEVNGTVDENRINNGNKFPSNYDKPHSLSLVMNYKVNRRLSLSTNFLYSTGRPITYPVSVYYAEGQELLYFSDRNKYRIPDYIRLDFSINLEGNLNKKKFIHSYWMLNLYNALGRKNAYSVFYEAYRGEVNGYKLSIFGLPILTISWNYKFGNYLNN